MCKVQKGALRYIILQIVLFASQIHYRDSHKNADPDPGYEKKKKIGILVDPVPDPKH